MWKFIFLRALFAVVVAVQFAVFFLYNFFVALFIHRIEIGHDIIPSYRSELFVYHFGVVFHLLFLYA